MALKTGYFNYRDGNSYNSTQEVLAHLQACDKTRTTPIFKGPKDCELLSMVVKFYPNLTFVRLKNRDCPDQCYAMTDNGKLEGLDGHAAHAEKTGTFYYSELITSEQK